MENPASWGKVEQVIFEAIQKHEQMLKEHIFGLSEVRMIADALREAGLIRERPRGRCEHVNMVRDRTDGRSYCPDCGACG